MLDGQLSSQVDRACHALSIDEERTVFTPILWSEEDECPPITEPDGYCYTHDERISQVWFAGAHSNVGGGYPDDSLAQVSLDWMMHEARLCGLQFKESPRAEPDAFLHTKSASDFRGRLYNSRSGLGAFYRYGPRDIRNLSYHLNPRNREDDVRIDLPKVHYTAIERIMDGAHPYAPTGLPANYAVVDEKGRILGPDKNPYETAEQAKFRYGHQSAVWDKIWKRRICYFGIVSVLIYLFFFPFFRPWQQSETVILALHPISYTIRLIAAFLPDFFRLWAYAHAQNPVQMLVALTALIALTVLNSSYANSISEHMRALWGKSFRRKLDQPPRPSSIYWLRTNRVYQLFLRKMADTACLLLIIYIAVFANRYIFDVLDDAGLVCRASEVEVVLAPDGKAVELPELFETKKMCQDMQVSLKRFGVYDIVLQNTQGFYDGDTSAAAGFPSMNTESVWKRIAMVATSPLRRELDRPWFTVVARIGERAGGELFLDADPLMPKSISERIRAERDGKLFLFVNDAIGVPGFYNLFYLNNRGSTRVFIRQVR
jgi:hypothetical protein